MLGGRRAALASIRRVNDKAKQALTDPL